MTSESYEVPGVEAQIRTHEQPLPKTSRELLDLVERSLKLTGVLEMRVTTDSFRVTRRVLPGEEVFPFVGDDLPTRVDLDFLMSGLDIHELPYTGRHHPFHELLAAHRLLERHNLVPTYMLAADGELLAAWLGLNETIPHGARVFGMRALFEKSELLDDKVLVFGTFRALGRFEDAKAAVKIPLPL